MGNLVELTSFAGGRWHSCSQLGESSSDNSTRRGLDVLILDFNVS